MRRDYEKLFSNLKPPEPRAGLFERIIAAIKKDQELRKTRRLLFGFFTLFVVSLIATPFSWILLVRQIENSGIHYFVSAALGNLDIFFVLWKDFGLAILESLPLTGLFAFAVSLGISAFTLRLFLYKKRLLLNYLVRGTI